MKQNKPSMTAEGVALTRAIESARPESERIFYDPLARSLVSGIKFALSKIAVDTGFQAKLSVGSFEFLLTRERYIDDFLIAGLREGLDQVVILGAGFDTRAYRIPGIEHVSVFEIDHPATQAVKLKRLKSVIDPLPDHVCFVPVDFNTQTLAQRLFANGYDEHGRTLFIWQGVTMYLTTEGIDSTLAFIANHSGANSAVIFDYFYPETLRNLQGRFTRWITRAIGEELLFGIEPDQIEPFLTRRGFCNVCSVDTAVLKQRYLLGPNASRAIMPGVAIASARVSGASGR